VRRPLLSVRWLTTHRRDLAHIQIEDQVPFAIFVGLPGLVNDVEAIHLNANLDIAWAGRAPLLRSSDNDLSVPTTTPCAEQRQHGQNGQ